MNDPYPVLGVARITDSALRRPIITPFSPFLKEIMHHTYLEFRAFLLALLQSRNQPNHVKSSSIQDVTTIINMDASVHM
jgi:hypothetical protein